MQLYANIWPNMHLFSKRPKYANICNYNFLSESAASKISSDFAFSIPYSQCSQNMHLCKSHNSDNNPDFYIKTARVNLTDINFGAKKIISKLKVKSCININRLYFTK